MIIKHNKSAMNANRMFLKNDDLFAKDSEKLSSGYKINRAADDAAGLAISEKMRRQIRCLTQASNNAQDGIALVQIADGAMNEIHDMLHRGTELSIKAANGTLTDVDRSYIQQEIAQLLEEIDHITDKTTFNEIRVFQQPEEITEDVIYKGNLPQWIPYTTSGSMDGSYITQEQYIITKTDNTTAPPTVTTSTGTAAVEHASATIDFSSFTGTAQQINDLLGNGFHTTCCTCERHYSIEFTEGTAAHKDISGKHYIFKIGIDGCTNASELIQRIIDGTNNGNPNGHYTNFAKDPANQNVLVIYDNRAKNINEDDILTKNNLVLQGDETLAWDSLAYSFNKKPNTSLGRGLFAPGIASEPVNDSYISIGLQIGSEAGQHLTIDLPNISCKALGITYADVSTAVGADDAIMMFKKANEYVSHERSRMGAYQNRLEHTIANLDNIVENTQAAESLIRDTDIAQTMLEFSNENILLQAGASMLSQANQSQSEVLALLQ